MALEEGRFGGVQVGPAKWRLIDAARAATPTDQTKSSRLSLSVSTEKETYNENYQFISVQTAVSKPTTKSLV